MFTSMKRTSASFRISRRPSRVAMRSASYPPLPVARQVEVDYGYQEIDRESRQTAHHGLAGAENAAMADVPAPFDHHPGDLGTWPEIQSHHQRTAGQCDG